MTSRFLTLLLALCLLIIPIGCASPQTQSPTGESQPSPAATPASPKTELTVAAAASLTDALNELKQTFVKDRPNVEITYAFGSSGKLAQQIIQGAPADLFLSASPADMDKLQEKQLIASDSLTTIALNELVLVTKKDSTLPFHSFEELKQAPLTHLAIGETKSVPAGRYAKQLLTQLGIWDQLQSKLVFGSDVRQVLTFVESGNADAGIVYATDAKSSDKVKVLATSLPKWHDPISYPGAVITNSAHQQEAQDFLHLLTSDAGKKILREYGFQ